MIINCIREICIFLKIKDEEMFPWVTNIYPEYIRDNNLNHGDTLKHVKQQNLIVYHRRCGKIN